MSDYSEPPDAPTNSGSNLGAWAQSVLGNAIGVYVDRTIKQPQTIQDPSKGVGIADGRMYALGQPGTVGETLVPGVSNVALLIGAALVVFVAFKMSK